MYTYISRTLKSLNVLTFVARMAYPTLKIQTFFGALLAICLFRTANLTNAKNATQTRIAETISLQQDMELNLREKFNQLFFNFTKNSSSFSKSFIYICDNDCTNNMYGHGLTSAFLIAVLSERRFNIYPNKESPFYRFYHQNKYQWKENATSLKNRRNMLMVPRSRNRHRQKTELFIVERDLFNLDFDSLFKEDVIYHYGNEDWVLDLRRHPKTAAKLPWLYHAHSSDMVRLIHNGLFRAPQFVEIIKAELRRQVGDDNFVCFSGNMEDKIHLRVFFDFSVKYFSNKSKIYVGGVANLQSYVMTSFPSLQKQLIEIDKKDINKHFAKYGMQNQKFFQKLIDIEVFKMCQVLVLTENPTGILAAQLRRDETHIFCYRNGTIFPCTRRLVGRSFNDVASQSDYIDSKYFCKLSPPDCVTK